MKLFKNPSWVSVSNIILTDFHDFSHGFVLKLMVLNVPNWEVLVYDFKTLIGYFSLNISRIFTHELIFSRRIIIFDQFLDSGTLNFCPNFNHFALFTQINYF